MKMLMVGDVLQVIGPLGVNYEQIRTWCEKGFIKPAAGGWGKGNSRRFTLMQAVGLAVAAKVYTGEQGCRLTYLRKVVSAFAGMTEEELVKEFRKGRTHFVTEHEGKPLLSSPRYPNWVDVQQTCQEVIATVDQNNH